MVERDIIRDNLTEEEYNSVNDMVLGVLIRKTVYVLYSEYMDMYEPYVNERFLRDDVSWLELLRYCRLHDIKVYLITSTKSRIPFIWKHVITTAFECYIEDDNLRSVVVTYFAKRLAEESAKDEKNRMIIDAN